MPVALRAAGAGTHIGSGSTLTLSLPLGTVSGDYLIAFVHSQASASTNDFTPPAGWAKIGPSFAASSTADRVTSMFAKFASGAEPSTYDFATPLTSGRMLGIIHAYSGVDTTTPVAASSGFSHITVPSATLNVAAFPASSSLYTIEFGTSQYAPPDSYVVSSYTGGLSLQSEVFRASGATQNPPSEDTTVSRTAFRIWNGVANAGGVVAHAITTTGIAAQSCMALIALNASSGGGGGGGGTTTPMIVGHTTATGGGATSTYTINPSTNRVGSSVQADDWVIAIIQGGADMVDMKQPTPPVGWTNLVPFQSPGTGAYEFGVWAHKHVIGEATYNWTQTTTQPNNSFHQLVFVRGADDISNWIIGSLGTRVASGGGATTVAPSLTTTGAHTLGLLLAGERTLAAETDVQVTCDNFTKQWFDNVHDHTLFVAAKDMVTAGATGSVTVTYPNIQANNGIALILGIPGISGPVETGLPIKISDGSSLIDAKFKLADGSGGLIVPGGYRLVKPGYSSVTAMLASNPFYVAHRGGSRDFPEMSKYAYGQTALRGYGALELSLGRTSDGVWFGLHDADINRTSGTTGLGAASTMTWAQVQSYQILGSAAPNNTTQPNRPYMRFEELLELYYPSHVLFIDIKYANAYVSEFITMINALPGTPQDHIVGKAFGVGSSFPNAMHAAGYKTWGYFYQADVPTNLANYQSYWDILGMDYNANSTAWIAVTGYGKPVIGHICPSVAAKNTAIAYGAVGLMCSGAVLIVPTTPYSNN